MRSASGLGGDGVPGFPHPGGAVYFLSGDMDCHSRHSYPLLRGAKNCIEKDMNTESSEDFMSLLQTTQFAIGQDDGFQVKPETIDLS